MPVQRRSLSGEARLYIDHLETSLATAEAQLQTLNDASATREQSSKLRHLNAETKQLREEIAEWESRYDDRVTELTDEHCVVESNLRNHVRKLEEDAEVVRYRISELESDLEDARQAAEAAERANEGLERRLEILSEILARSPSKIDLRVEADGKLGRSGRRRRPKSMFPRLPTTRDRGLESPERAVQIPVTQPGSPVYLRSPKARAERGPGQEGGLDSSCFPNTPLGGDMGEASDLGYSPGVSHNDGHDDLDPPLSTSTESATTSNPWTSHAVHASPTRNNNARPTRRMRRFGAGAHGVKPLILPSATGGCWQGDASWTAPVLERSETSPAFSFLPLSNTETGCDGNAELSGRRRASTEGCEGAYERLASTPILRPPPSARRYTSDSRTHAPEDASLLNPLGSPRDASEEDTTVIEYPSLSASTGRNLLEELSALGRCASSSSGVDHSNNEPTEHQDESMAKAETTVLVTAPTPPLSLTGSADHDPATTPTAATPRSFPLFPPAAPTGPIIPTSSPTASIWHRLRTLFGDLARSPVTVAQHLVQTAQTRLYCLPAPLRSVQWWLVGMLLGPMARRRAFALSDVRAGRRGSGALLEAGSSPPSSRVESAQLVPDTTEAGEPGAVVRDASGARLASPPPPPPASLSSTPSRQGTISGKGRKRTTARQRRDAGVVAQCQTDQWRQGWSRHSPWLWLKFSLTLAFAVGVAFRDGPGSLLLRGSGGGCAGGGRGGGGGYAMRRGSREVSREERRRGGEMV